MADKEVRQAVLDLLEVVPLQTLRIALLYARNYAEYGEDVTKTWATATEQSAALEGARNRGYYDGLKSADAFKAKAEVVISQLRADRDRLDTALDEIRVEIKAMFPPSGSWMYDEDPGRCNVVCEVLTDVLQIIDKHRKGEE